MRTRRLVIVWLALSLGLVAIGNFLGQKASAVPTYQCCPGLINTFCPTCFTADDVLQSQCHAPITGYTVCVNGGSRVCLTSLSSRCTGVINTGSGCTGTDLMDGCGQYNGACGGPACN